MKTHSFSNIRVIKENTDGNDENHHFIGKYGNQGITIFNIFFY
jgi:hypothetical protein